jgi:hypothetical protein
MAHKSLSFIDEGEKVKLLIPGRKKPVYIKKKDLARFKEWLDSHMGKVWQPLTLDTYLGWVEAIIGEASDALTGKERGFIHDMEVLIKYKKYLPTENQARWLESIYAKYTS